MLGTAAPLLAQTPDWVRSQGAAAPRGSFDFAMAADDARGGLVLFLYPRSSSGGFQAPETWQWRGSSWSLAAPLHTAPVPDATAYDSGRGRVVVFGAASGTQGMFEWDGVDWTQVLTPVAPSRRSGTAMAYDSRRGRVFLFGGFDNVPFNTFDRSDAWEYDGATWTQRLSAHAPAPRSFHAMAYDSVRGRVVLQGGVQHQPPPSGAIARTWDDTWEWDGSDWTFRAAGAPPSLPESLRTTGMAFDSRRGCTVLFTPAAPSPVWEWDGNAWSNRTTTGPQPSLGGCITFDSTHGNAVVFEDRQTWTWDGTAWRVANAAVPERSLGVPLAYDRLRARTVLFGSGYHGGVTWEWDGRNWTHRLPATSPPDLRSFHGLAHDEQRRCSVLFGGDGPADTWVWDGVDWTRMAPTTSPSPRLLPGMAYDGQRRRVMLFGGQDPATVFPFNDTWEWDGLNWTQAATSSAPSPRSQPAMAYDRRRQRTVLFGGSFFVGFNDTWEWDGVGWTQATPAVAPQFNALVSSMAYDEQRARVVLSGGRTGAPAYETWEWDGASWTQLATTAAPPTGFPLARHMAYDAQRGQHLLLDENGDTWELGVAGFAIASALGDGCGSPPLTAAAAAGSRPVLGQTQTIELTNVPAGTAFMCYGWSNTSAGPFRLPLPLAPFGMPGCDLLQSIDMLAEPCTGTGPGTAQHVVLVPNLPYLLGVHVWLQAWAPAPGQNAAGVVVSNGMSLYLGAV